MTYSFTPLHNTINEVESWLKEQLSGIRTGRATPALIENISVDAYSTPTPVKQIASVTVEDARTLFIAPWDASLIKAVERAISQANLGISPLVDTRGIRIVFPELTAERRNELLKLAHGKSEEARIRLRQARDETWHDIQEKERAGELSEDEKFRLKEEMEGQANEGNEKLAATLQKKEVEINPS